MPRPALRTRSVKRKYVKLPGGRTTIHYKRKKPGYAKCMLCGGKLGGVPRGTPAEIRKLAHSERRPERIYGGVLCPKCLKQKLKEAIRFEIAKT